MVADKVADMVADIVADMVADIVADMVADMELDMVADLEVDKVADIFKNPRARKIDSLSICRLVETSSLVLRKTAPYRGSVGKIEVIAATESKFQSIYPCCHYNLKVCVKTDRLKNLLLECFSY